MVLENSEVSSKITDRIGKRRTELNGGREDDVGVEWLAVVELSSPETLLLPPCVFIDVEVIEGEEEDDVYERDEFSWQLRKFKVHTCTLKGKGILFTNIVVKEGLLR